MVEKATYDSKIVSERTCGEQIINLRSTPHYLGLSIEEESCMFADNESVVNSSTNLYIKLHKQHTALVFHRVREAIASGNIVFNFICSKINPAVILSKHWNHSSVWLMFWSNNTISMDEPLDVTIKTQKY